MSHKLSDLNVGEKAEVDSIENTPNMKRRLLDIGVCEGTIIECIGKSPLGDPKSFLIRGAVIALRNDDSQNIYLKGGAE